MKTKYEDCKKPNAEDCFGRCMTNMKKCKILTDTNFKGYECPFYKTTKEFIDGQLKYGNGYEYIKSHTLNT